MTSKNKRSESRRPYTTPLIEKVKLVSEEAVLAACKTGSSGPHKNHPCQPQGNCYYPGS